MDIYNEEMEYHRRLIFSVGISVVMLMVGGLGINHLLYAVGIEKPLNSLYFVFVYIGLIGFLITYLYLTDYSEKIYNTFMPNWNLSEIFFLSLSVALLIFVIYSSLYLRINNSNVLLIISYILISIMFSIIIFTKKIHQNKYPIFLIILGLSLILITSIRYNYIMGYDVFQEYQLYKHIDVRGHWSVITEDTYLMSSLGINFLPVVTERLIGFEGLTTYRYIIPIIFSLSAISVYDISSQFIDNNKALISAFAYCSTLHYLRPLSSPRTILAIFFCSLLALTFLEIKKIHKTKFPILFVILSLGIIVSHYSTSYVFLFTLLLLFVLKQLGERFSQKEANNIKININAWQLIVYFSLIYVWLSLSSPRVFKRGIIIVYDSLVHFLTGVRVEESVAMGAGMETWIFPRYIEFLVSWVIMLLVAVCVIYLFKIWISSTARDTDKTFFVFILGGAVLFAFLLFPTVAQVYGFQRTRIYSMIFFSPGFVLGSFLIFKNKKILGKIFVVSIIGLYLFSYSGVTYQLVGYQEGPALVTEGDFYMGQNIGVSEVYGAQWLDRFRIDNIDIFTSDEMGDNRLNIGFSTPEDRFEYVQMITKTLPNNTYSEIDGYIYLYEANVRYGKRYDSESRTYSVDDNVISISMRGSKIYSSGNTEIFITNTFSQ